MSSKIIINGASGKMGHIADMAIQNAPGFDIVARLGRNDDLQHVIQSTKADIVIDLTSAETVYKNSKIIIENNAKPVIGTSGLLENQINELSLLCHEKKLGGLIVPNFSIGAILMMRYAQDAAKYYADVEIIETHHPYKLDAPSGTAIKTAQLISSTIENKQLDTTQKELLPGARGAKLNNIPIHSLRLPGKVAHQQVIFGSHGETLTIQHDTINRECFIPGIVLACQKVLELDHLVYGLDDFL